MRKIRGFKLKLRVKEIQRRAKKAKLDLGALGFTGEAPLQAWLDRLASASAPAVLFDSFPAEETSGLSPMPGLACSLAVATLGPDLDAFAEKLAQDKPAEAPLFELAAQSALDEAVRFVLALVEEEAAAERCVLSPIQYLDSREQQEQILAKLEGHKIGVALGENGLRPIRSTSFSASWLAKSKSRAKA
ncbi:MAG: hypothetical protein HY925_07685 [Elusimicrobia bacterium]|nr:hypothetical protein [Elusimicrobiota bacterium]